MKPLELARAHVAASWQLKQSLSDELLERVCEFSRVTAQSLRQGGKVLFMGNGGSAADAQHIAAELVGRYRLPRPAMPAIALTTNASILTAVANDYSFEDIFARQLEGFSQPGDVVVGISTSGNSPNILRGLEVARAKRAYTVGMTGATGGKMRSLVDLLLNVPSEDTQRIQEVHILIGHIFCDLVERHLASPSGEQE